MAGLLDFNDPGTRLGMGLLALGQAPRSQFGQGLLGLFNSMDNDEERKAVTRYREAQTADMQRKTEMERQKQGLLMGLLGGGVSGAPAVPSGSGVSGGAGSSAAMPSAGGGGFGNLTLAQIATLKALGGPDLLEHYKLNQTGVKQDAGSYYTKDGRTQLMPQLGPGQVLDPGTGQVLTLPGYAGSNAEIEGAKAGAVAQAQYPYTVGANREQQQTAANLDAMEVYNQATGRKELVPRAQVVRPQPAQNFTGPGYNGGSAANAAQEQVRIMQAEMAKLPEGHPDRAAISREIARLQGFDPRESGNYAAGPSAAEVAAQEAAKTRAVNTAAADVVRDTTRQSENKRAQQLTAGIDRGIELLGQGPTGSLLGTAVDRGLGAFGKSTKGAETAEQLSALSGWLVSNVPRMEGPQSNVDVQNYQTMAGRIGNSMLPIGTRLAAAKEVKRLQEKYMHLNGGEQQTQQPQQKQAVKTGTHEGRKVVQYSDGSIDYAD